MTEYILFVIECANFCPRTGLVPKKEFIEARQSDYEILKSNAVKYNGIDQVLFQNIIWTGRTGRHEKTEWGHVISDIRMYIEADDRDDWGGVEDRKWIDGIITDLSQFQFNSMKIMKNLEKKTFIIDDKPIIVSESFLMMEKHDGKIRNEPKYDTVPEFLASYLTEIEK